MSDPVRRQILLLLRDGKVTSGEIAQNFNLTNATVSYHLKQLKEVELIFEEKKKQFIYYELNVTVFEELMIWLQGFKGGMKNDRIKK